MNRLMTRAKRAVSFKHDHPEWAELAYEVLFRRDAKEPYDLQYAVAQALHLAWRMGREGRTPPLPRGAEPRKHPPKPQDAEVDEIAHELRMLAWGPMAGVPAPEGHMRWAMDRIVAQRKPKMVRRTAAPTPTPRRRVL